MFKKFKKSSGGIAQVLIALVVVVIIAILIAYIVIKRAEKPPVEPPPTPDLLPVYEATLGDIRFLFLEAIDEGSVLRGSDSNQPEWQEDLETTERFIKLKIGAQNVGKENTVEKIWGIGEIIDSEGRKFIPSGQEVSSWLPPYDEDLCGSVLRPSFEPSPCIQIYEVAEISTGLKVKVILYNGAYSDDVASEAMLDILLMP